MRTLIRGVLLGLLVFLPTLLLFPVLEGDTGFDFNNSLYGYFIFAIPTLFGSVLHVAAVGALRAAGVEHWWIPSALTPIVALVALGPTFYMRFPWDGSAALLALAIAWLPVWSRRLRRG